MAVFHGKRGTVTFSGLTLNTASFSIEGAADVVETTIMDTSAVAADKHWKDYVAGFKDWTATIEAYDDSAGIGTIGTVLGSEQTLTLDTTTGLSNAGTAILTGISIGCGADGAGTVTFTFQGTAVLAAS